MAKSKGIAKHMAKFAEDHAPGTYLRWSDGRTGYVTGHIRGVALIRYDDDPNGGPYVIKMSQPCEVIYA